MQRPASGRAQLHAPGLAGADHLESGLAEKDLGILVNNLNASAACP